MNLAHLRCRLSVMSDLLIFRFLSSRKLHQTPAFAGLRRPSRSGMTK